MECGRQAAEVQRSKEHNQYEEEHQEDAEVREVCDVTGQGGMNMFAATLTFARAALGPFFSWHGSYHAVLSSASSSFDAFSTSQAKANAVA